MTNSRILKRNRLGFVHEEIGEVEETLLPQSSRPQDTSWQWPTNVNTPFKYGYYIQRLHRQRGLKMVFPVEAFQRFASKHKALGFEQLTRAAALAANYSHHPFSPKHIERFLEEVPSNQVLPQVLF